MSINYYLGVFKGWIFTDFFQFVPREITSCRPFWLRLLEILIGKIYMTEYKIDLYKPYNISYITPNLNFRVKKDGWWRSTDIFEIIVGWTEDKLPSVVQKGSHSIGKNFSVIFTCTLELKFTSLNDILGWLQCLCSIIYSILYIAYHMRHIN